MRNPILALALALLLPTAPTAAADAPGSECGVTLTAGPLTLRRCDFTFSRHGDKVMLLVDAYPYRAELKGKEEGALRELALALVQGQAQPKHPKARSFKVIVAEIPERDVYGLPRWDTLKVLQRFSWKADKKGKLTLETPAH